MIGQTVADILRFCDFQDGWRHHLGFQKFEILTSIQCRSIRVILPNLIKIGQTVAEIWRFNGFCFFKMATVRHLGRTLGRLMTLCAHNAV